MTPFPLRQKLSPGNLLNPLSKTEDDTPVIPSPLLRACRIRIERLAHSIAENGDPCLGNTMLQVEIFEDIRSPLKTKLEIVLIKLLGLLERLVVCMALDDDVVIGVLALEASSELIQSGKMRRLLQACHP